MLAYRVAPHRSCVCSTLVIGKLADGAVDVQGNRRSHSPFCANLPEVLELIRVVKNACVCCRFLPSQCQCKMHTLRNSGFHSLHSNPFTVGYVPSRGGKEHSATRSLAPSSSPTEPVNRQAKHLQDIFQTTGSIPVKAPPRTDSSLFNTLLITLS